MRIFVLGQGPLPTAAGVDCHTAYGLRTHQFLSMLERLPSKFKVEMVLLEEVSMRELRSQFRAFRPEACIGVNNLAAYTLAKLEPRVPFWADLNGWLLAEAQSAAYRHENDGYFPSLLKREQAVLRVADRFSTVSSRQGDALLGELAMMGRLNARTDQWRFVETIPNANELDLLKEKPEMFDLRGDWPKDSTVVFFSGAYNTWLDEDLLFEGLELAMEKDESIHFASTGSGVPGLSNKVFDRFLARCQGSRFTARFKFLGWLSRSQLLSCYKQASLGINVDRPNVESHFGARNRINEWMAFKLPVVSTTCTEITQELLGQDALIPIQAMTAQGVCEAILSGKHKGASVAKRAYVLSHTRYSIDSTMQPLKDWLLEGSTKAPDFGYSPPRRFALARRIISRLRRFF